MPDETTRETRRGDAPRDETHAGRRGMMRRFLPLAGLAGVMLAVYLSGGHAFLSLSNLIRQRAALAALVEANLLLACATFAVVYVVAVALSFPGASLLTIMGGFLFGWLLGGTLTAVSILCYGVSFSGFHFEPPRRNPYQSPTLGHPVLHCCGAWLILR